MNFAVLPHCPTRRSTRCGMFLGAGPAPMRQAAAAWDVLAEELAARRTLSRR
ncbi:hypothetical protein H0P51_10580 [Mycobacterium vicinigordonae]|uniref:PPE domain-containing protein n=1 Tax=Mycobacterium vicinigordonae TaxID=1719132 RepID=A0A7D6E7Y9_9MYCO|nr:hypothetical protein H0P51_10580 [Mycobacterium vicinigordonae]